MEHIPRRRAKKFVFTEAKKLQDNGVQVKIECYKRKNKDMVKILLGSK